MQKIQAESALTILFFYSVNWHVNEANIKNTFLNTQACVWHSNGYHIRIEGTLVEMQRRSFLLMSPMPEMCTEITPNEYPPLMD